MVRMRRVDRTKGYLKALAKIPKRDQDRLEMVVDQLEGPWTGMDFKPLEGFRGWWRLRVGDYRVFCCIGQERELQVVSVEDVKRRGTTTYP